MDSFVLSLVDSSTGLTADQFFQGFIDLLPWIVLFVPVAFGIGMVLYAIISTAPIPPRN